VVSRGILCFPVYAGKSPFKKKALPQHLQPGPWLALSPSSHSSAAYLVPGVPSLSLFTAWALALCPYLGLCLPALPHTPACLALPYLWCLVCSSPSFVCLQAGASAYLLCL